MIGLLTYLPTTAYLPQFFFLLAFLYVLVRERNMFLERFTFFINDPKHPLNWNFLIIILIILFSTINRLIHWNAVGDYSEFFPYFILLIPTYVIAIGFKKKDAQVLAWLVAIEAVVVILEWMLGVSTFDTSLTGFVTFKPGDLAYFQRPLGLSESSSHIASKLFVAFMAIDFFKFKHNIWVFVKVLMVAAVVLTFNRSVILALSIYIGISQFIAFSKFKYKMENAVVAFVSFVLGGIGFLTILVLKGKDLIAQLTRNTGKIELTGREYLWADFYVFIEEHLVFGNNSIKLWLDGYHAHNSYIEVIATNGIFIALFYFILVYRNIKGSNWYFVIPILIFGVTQYAFFWGISLFDILFWAILFQTNTPQVGDLNLKQVVEVPVKKQLIDLELKKPQLPQ